MRISTGMLYDQGVLTMQNQTEALLKIQNQMSTQRRIQSPSDDPSASSRALAVTQNQSIVDQFNRNANMASSALAMHESTLGTINDQLDQVRTLAVYAGNGSMTLSDRTAIATELQGHYNTLLGLANTRDGNGQFMFSGYQGSTLPFTETSPGTVAYNGDQGQRTVQISSYRQVPVSSAGSDVFQRIHNGNGTFVTAASATNSGSGVVDPGLVLNAGKWNNAANSKDYSVNFFVDTTVSPNVTTYDIVDNVSGNSMLSGGAAGAGPFLRTYTSGTTISLATQSPPDTNPTPFDYGAQLTISGAPASGDTITVKASTNQDIFSTIHNLIVSLQGGAATNSAVYNNNNTALSNIDLAQQNVLTAQTTMGALMKEVDGQVSSNGDLSLQYKTVLSQLQDLDMIQATSDLTRQKTSLDAAQLSFAKIQGLSLFNYLK